MKKVFVIVFALSFISLFAQPSMGFRKDCIKKLNLTKEQVATFEDMRNKHQKAMIDLRADLQKLMVEKRELLQKKDFNRKAITDVENRIVDQRNKIHMAGFNNRMDMLAQLTPEQREKVPAMFQEGMRKFKDKRGKGQFRGRGGRGGCMQGIDCPNY